MNKFVSDDIALTYDDVLIVPKFSTIASRFSNDINPYWVDNKLPIVVANMNDKGNLLKIIQGDYSKCSIVK